MHAACSVRRIATRFSPSLTTRTRSMRPPSVVDYTAKTASTAKEGPAGFGVERWNRGEHGEEGGMGIGGKMVS